MKEERNTRTPTTVLQFLSWFCPDHLYEEIEGDLIQKFNKDVNAFGEQRARRRLIWNTLRFFRAGIILRNKFSIELNQMDMIKSYLTVLIRHIWKRKFYSAINILCLTVGITFALLIGMFIYSELQVNQDLKEVDKLYLLESKTKPNETVFPFTPGILPKQAHEQYPALVEGYYRFLDRNITVSKEDKHFRLQSMIGDSSFIEMFGFHVLHGDGANALKEPNSIVITKSVANQFFNTLNVVGESLTVSTEQNGFQEYKVTAVIDDPADKNSVTDFMNMNAQVFISFENSKDFFVPFDPNSWQEVITYLKISQGNSNEVLSMLNKIISKEAPKLIAETKVISINPIKDYYRTTNRGAVQKLVLSLCVVVIFILLLAISNFINISVASSVSRSKEVGVRKVIGGLQKQVLAQFLLESIVLSVFSGVLAILGYELFHGFFGQLLSSQLPPAIQFDGIFWFIIVASVILIGFLAGIYPAVFQSLARPIDSLKGKFKSVKSTLQFSQTLIGIQFFITLFVFIGAVVLSKQATYFLEKDLGFNKSHVLVVTSVPRLWNEAGFAKMESAKKEFLRSSQVESVSLSWGAPGWNFSPGGDRVYKAGTSAEQAIDFVITGTDENYKSVFDLKIAEGDFLDESGTRVRNGVVINQAAQKALGVQLGDQLKGINSGDSIFTIKGILNDFHFASLHDKIDPLMIMHTNDFQAYRYFSFRLKPGSVSESVSEMERLWKSVFPDDPFDFSFEDQRLESVYTTELQMKKAATVATILMLIILLTGILGLVSLSVSKRSKEIGVRKVLGASVSNILMLLSKEYLRLMIVAFILAVPITYFFAMQWLKSFVYHIDLNWWMFVMPVLCLLLITVIIVCAQSLKTALTNPVSSLKYE